MRLSEVGYTFRRFFNGGRNFMTPKVNSYGICEASASPPGTILIYEISTGSGMLSSDQLVGVTFLLVKGDDIQRQPLINKCFSCKVHNQQKTINEAMQYARWGGGDGDG